ncbi:MAG: GNAT family protein [Pyrinomonadaceae bacterium]
MMFSFEITDGIALGIIEERHADEFFALVRRNYERVLAWCPWLDQVESVEKTKKFIQEKLTRFADGNGFTAGIFDDGNLVGVIALEYIDRPNRATEVGYWLDAGAEGKGLIVRTCGALIGYAFHDLGLNRIQIRCAAENVRSRAIPERLGFVQEGVIRQCERLHDRTVDLVIYGMLADEWKSRN